jgi:hypothetical protein
MMSSSDLSGALTQTSNRQANVLLMQLSQHKQVWLMVPTKIRLKYLATCLENFKAVSESWAEAACSMKGLDPTIAIAGEEWLVGPLEVWVQPGKPLEIGHKKS